MSTVEQLEVRLAALEKKQREDLDFVIKSVEQDQDVTRASIQVDREAADRAVSEIRTALQELVDSLIASSSSVIVAEALRSALSKTVLLVRQPTREESSRLPVFLTRTATRDELRLEVKK